MKLTRGLSPAQKSWLFEHQNNLYATNERLHKLGKKNSPNCEFCEEKDDRVHLFFCSFNKAITSSFLNILEEACMEKPSPTQLALADFHPPRLARLAFLFLFCEISVQLQKSRVKRKELSSQHLVSSVLAKAGTFQQAHGHQSTYDLVFSWLQTFIHATQLNRPVS